MITELEHAYTTAQKSHDRAEAARIWESLTRAKEAARVCFAIGCRASVAHACYCPRHRAY